MGNYNIECVSSYKYLGVHFTVSGIFNIAQQELYKKGLKAYFKLKKVTESLCSASTMFHLFDSTVKPAILYGSEIWGMPKNLDVRKFKNDLDLEQKLINYYKCEDLHTMVCRQILGVHKKCSKMTIYGETGRWPLYIDIITNMVKYYNRILEKESSKLLKESLLSNKILSDKGKTNWYSCIVNIIKHIGIDVNYGFKINVKKVKTKLKARFDIFWKKQVCNEIPFPRENGGKLRAYSNSKLYEIKNHT